MGLTDLDALAERLGIAAIDPTETVEEVIPTNANSEFMANRAMGDWAERHVRKMVTAAGYFAAKYGEDNSMVAGEEGFEEMYLENRQSQRQLGKRPDVLVFDRATAKSLGLGTDLSKLTPDEQQAIVPHALVAIEVRSSKFRAAVYHRVRAAQVAQGKAVQRYQSFTPKVEDLPLILRWVRTYGVPHMYMQVLLDEMYAIPFEAILRVLAARSGLNLRRRASLPAQADGFAVSDLRGVKVQQPQRSNFKKTHMIPVSFGRKVAEVADWKAGKPKFRPKVSESKLGRIDAYVAPVGGDFALVNDHLKQLVLDVSRMR